MTAVEQLGRDSGNREVEAKAARAVASGVDVRGKNTKVGINQFEDMLQSFVTLSTAAWVWSGQMLAVRMWRNLRGRVYVNAGCDERSVKDVWVTDEGDAKQCVMI